MRPLLRNVARGWLPLILGAAMPGMAASLERGDDTSTPPNILFILVDDLRPQLGCYGQEETLSPSIDRLAREGMVFKRAYCQVPVCGASRASLLTGLYPTAERFVTYHARADEEAPGIQDLPGCLKAQGYTTISNGKIYHHAKDNRASWDEMHRPRDFRVYLAPENQGLEPKHQPAYEAADVPDDAYPAGALTRKIIGDLRRAKKEGTPFFITAGFTKPHLPFNAPKKYWDLYDRESIQLADNPFRPTDAPQQAMHQWNELRNGYAGMPKEGPLPEELARTLIHGYYACVSYTDAMVGRLLDELDRLDMRDNTLVVLLGDHGWQLGEHALWCKHALFNTSLSSPLIVSVPGYPARQRTEALVEFVDIFPSLCELAGIPLPDHLQGKSFVPLLQDPSVPWKEAVFSRYHGGESVRTDRYLYTRWKDGAQMLYDHREDPDENTNVASRPENVPIVESLRQLLEAHQAHLDPLSEPLSRARRGGKRLPAADPGSGAPSLKDTFAGAFEIGASLGNVPIDGHDHQYPSRRVPEELAVLEREFGCVTSENCMKWKYLQPEEGFFNFAEADAFMELAEQRGLDVAGHVLVWHDQIPAWVFEDDNGRPATRDMLIERMRNHIHTVVGRYKGRIKYWDVVNEAVRVREIHASESVRDGTGPAPIRREASFRDTPWLEIIGEEYIELAFRFAHEADPDSRLLYNDYSMSHAEKAEFVAEMVRTLRARGVPIHGIGMQAHWHVDYPSLEELQAALDIFASTGIPVSLTELDIGVLPLAHHLQGADIRHRVELQARLNPYANGVPAHVLQRQADTYAGILDLLVRNHHQVERVTWWSISDQNSWLNNYPVPGRTAYPSLFDRNYQPKPAYFELLKLRRFIRTAR